MWHMCGVEQGHGIRASCTHPSVLGLGEATRDQPCTMQCSIDFHAEPCRAVVLSAVQRLQWLSKGNQRPTRYLNMTMYMMAVHYLCCMLLQPFLPDSVQHSQSGCSLQNQEQSTTLVHFEVCVCVCAEEDVHTSSTWPPGRAIKYTNIQYRYIYITYRTQICMGCNIWALRH